MSHRLVILPEAEADVLSARQWYEAQRPGLSLEVRSALDTTLAQITATPELYARVYRDLRRALLHRFPYGVFYAIRVTDVIVFAVLHTARKPATWRGRLRRES